MQCTIFDKSPLTLRDIKIELEYVKAMHREHWMPIFLTHIHDIQVVSKKFNQNNLYWFIIIGVKWDS